MTLPQIAPFTPGILRPPEAKIPFPVLTAADSLPKWSGVKSEEFLLLLASSKKAQEATTLDQQGLVRQMNVKWTVDGALRDCKFLAKSRNVSNDERYQLSNGRTPIDL